MKTLDKDETIDIVNHILRILSKTNKSHIFKHQLEVLIKNHSCFTRTFYQNNMDEMNVDELDKLTTAMNDWTGLNLIIEFCIEIDNGEELGQSPRNLLLDDQCLISRYYDIFFDEEEYYISVDTDSEFCFRAILKR